MIYLEGCSRKIYFQQILFLKNTATGLEHSLYTGFSIKDRFLKYLKSAFSFILSSLLSLSRIGIFFNIAYGAPCMEKVFGIPLYNLISRIYCLLSFFLDRESGEGAGEYFIAR